MFGDFYKGKRVLVTGHTGFKGSWLCTWLLDLGAEVFGYSIDIPTNPSLFLESTLDKKMDHQFGDVRDYEKLKQRVDDVQPDVVFHLAAQPIVSTSYKDPLLTVTTNVLGVSNMLEALRHLNKECQAVIVTSDKCYENLEWVWGYRETDRVGGKDMYSGSKGAAEVIFHSFYESFFKDHPVKIATGRAGNVIGGGDWALDRIVPDAMKAWKDSEPVVIRRPKATRPWQHVLEPLSGYMTLAWRLSENAKFSGESYNFGPRSNQNATVQELLEDLGEIFSDRCPSLYDIQGDTQFEEAGYLKLNCDKALLELFWEPVLEYDTLTHMVSRWYHEYYLRDANTWDLTLTDLHKYQNDASGKKMFWV